MNNGKLVRKYFDFLCKYGFKRKKFTNGVDYEFVYRKSMTVIEVGCVLGIIDRFIEPDFRDHYNLNHFKNQNDVFFGIYVIITVNKERENILYCNLFDEESRIKLKTDIEKVKKDDLEKLLDIYSQFIMQNISKLI